MEYGQRVSERVAVVTDIHGNLPALQAALARIDELGVETVYCGGDLVGYGPHPNEVCALIQEREIPPIYGNYDYAIGRDHAEAVAEEIREVGLPAEFADKLVVAA
jgi:predicted phosphodiesterase